MMDGKKCIEMIPYFNKFKGNVIKISNTEFKIEGNYEKINDTTIRITELPIGQWTMPYKEFLEEKQDCIKNNKNKQLITKFKYNCTDEIVDILITMDEDLLDKLIASKQLKTKLKLIKTIKLNNMHMYNTANQIKKYITISSIMKEFYDNRLIMYTKRKNYMINKLTKEMNLLKYKKQFIEHVIDKTIIIAKQQKIKVIEKLIELKYPPLSSDDNDMLHGYDYLTSMELFSLTEEKVKELNDKYNNKVEELHLCSITTEIDQWKSELNEFEETYNKWIKMSIQHDTKNNTKKIIKKK